MKSSLFVRPNLKLFLLAASLVLLVNHLFVSSAFQALARELPLVGKTGKVTDAEFDRLVRHVTHYPSAEGYLRLSHCYEERREFRRAMECLVQARQLADLEE